MAAQAALISRLTAFLQEALPNDLETEVAVLLEQGVRSAPIIRAMGLCQAPNAIWAQSARAVQDRLEDGKLRANIS